jgi:hypothetical protein
MCLGFGGYGIVEKTPPECLGDRFCELRIDRVLGSAAKVGAQKSMRVASKSSPSVTLGSKNIRTGEAPPVKSGDRQPEQQTLVVPQRQCLRLVVYVPVQRPLPPRRGTTTHQYCSTYY